MKTIIKRIWSIILILCLCWSLLPNVAVPMETEASTGLSLSELRQKFPHGKYWNHAGNPGYSNSVNNQDGYTSTPCSQHGVVGTSKQTCNGFQPSGSQLSWQCMGYAEKLGYDATGYNPRNNANGWYTYTSSSALDNLKPGDIVRYKNNGHSIYVTGVNGDTVTYTDCNSDGHCIIRWDATISKATLRASFTHVRSAPSAVSPGSTSCSCSTSYAGTYVCTTSSLNLTIRSGHGSSYSAIGSIPPGATVTVTKASGSGSSDWAHVTYNGITGYASMQYLSKKQATQERINQIHLWLSDSEMGDGISTIRTGEWLYLCYKLYDANTGDLLDTYNTDGYTAKLTLYGPDGAVAHTYTFSDDSSWISIKRTTPGTYRGELVFAWDAGGTTTSEVSINMVYEPRVTPSSSDIQLNVTGSKSQTISISYSGATNSDSVYLTCATTGACFDYEWGNWSDNKMPLTVTGVRAGQGVITINLHDSDTKEIIATSQVYVTVTAPTYTVSYNANGGNNAPSSQTKPYGTDITLSSTVPTRSGYTFKGWATSSTATSATYQPGGTFSSNANTTLYAVWQANPTTALSVNSTNNAVISTGGEMKYFTYTPTTSGTYVIYSTGTEDTKVWLYNESGNALGSDDESGDGSNFRLECNLTAGTKYTFGVKYYISSKTGTITFKFGHVYTVTYNANGGSGAPSNQGKDYGTDITLSSSVPTRSGYTFKGWATSSTATSATYQPGGTFSSNANTTLYAVWQANPTTISVNSINNIIISTGGEMKYFTYTPTTSGTYVIYSTGTEDTKVWLYDVSGNTLESDDDDGVGNNFRLEYNLTAGTKYTFGVKYYNSSKTGTITFKFGNVYTVTYNANGGSGAPANQKKDYGTDITLSSNVPTRSGYTFKGWATSSTATSATYQPGVTFTSNANTTLYAVWEQDATLSSISVYNNPIKTTYYIGDTFDSSGLVIKATYSDGRTENILSGFTTSGYSSSSAGKKSITVSYGGKTATFYILVKTPDVSLSASSLTMREGTTTTITATTDPSAMNITWVSSNESVATVTDGLITAQGAGTATITAKITYNGTVYSKSCEVTVNENSKTLSALAISSMPVKTIYQVGDSFDATGLTLLVIYSDGTTEIISSGFNLSGFNSETAGTKKIFVSYGGSTLSFDVTIEEVSITGAKYELTDVTGTAGSTVDVYVSIEDNPGIISLRNMITYDTSALELINIQDCGLLAGYTTPSTTITSPYTLRWTDSLATQNNSSNGQVVKLTFQIKDNVEVGSYNISVSHVEARNVDGAKVLFSGASATVDVIDCIIGDTDGDGEVSDWDAIILNRYLAGWNVEIELTAADVDGDGEVSDWDAIVLERYLAGWNVELNS